MQRRCASVQASIGNGAIKYWQRFKQVLATVQARIGNGALSRRKVLFRTGNVLFFAETSL
jgi:hypothetical protein